MSSNDSKTLWLDLEREIRPEAMPLGRYTTQAYLDDPCALAFISARYKFCAKLLSSKDRVLEIGCGDGFGGALVAQKVKNLICEREVKYLSVESLPALFLTVTLL